MNDKQKVVKHVFSIDIDPFTGFILFLIIMVIGMAVSDVVKELAR